MRQVPFLSAIAAAITLLLLLTAGPAAAHLAVIRQGPESADLREAGDAFGTAVASGDFNGDGFEDLATGAPYEDYDGASNCGMLVISWGSAFGLTEIGAVSYAQDGAGGVTDPDNHFGAALAVGDFNGDGYDDLAVGAPGDDLGIAAGAGQVHVLRGSASGLQNWVSLHQGDVAGLVSESGDRFGQTLCAANFDGDGLGYDDLVVGVPGEDAEAGLIVHFPGGVLGPGSGTATVLTESAVGGTSTPGNQFGFSFAAGNLVGDGTIDLAVGVPFYSVPSGTSAFAQAGRVYVLPGKLGDGVVAAGASSYLSSYAQHPDISTVPQLNGHFGYALTTGNFYDVAGGYDTLAIGEPGAHFYGSEVGGGPAEIWDAGRVIVLDGGATGLVNTPLVDVVIPYANGSELNWSNDARAGSVLATARLLGDDTYDDLVVGAPDMDSGGAYMSENIDAGGLYVVKGSGFWFAVDGGQSWYHLVLNSEPRAGAGLGGSIAVGSWDDTGREGLAVGAAGEDGDEGAVYVVAPWRQNYNQGLRHAIVRDCWDNDVYSLRAFDQVWIASATKIMTVLLACEAMQLPAGDPDYIDGDMIFELPSWNMTIPGSTFGFWSDEAMSFLNLAYACLMRSGNDAAHMLGWIMAGRQDADTATTDFVAQMNARAVSLGMFDTNFTNPAGLDEEVVTGDLGDHYSTPRDMAALSRHAMNNPLFAQIAGTRRWDVTRLETQSGQVIRMTPWSITNIFNAVLNGLLAEGAGPVSGIKGGSTDLAQATGCFSATTDTPGRFVVAGSYLTSFDVSDAVYTPEAMSLLQLGLDRCSYELDPAVYTELPPFWLPSTSTESGAKKGASFEILEKGDTNRGFTLCRTDGGTGDAHVRLSVDRSFQFEMKPWSYQQFGVAPFDSHDGIVITNHSDRAISFDLSANHPGNWGPRSLKAGESDTIPAYSQGPNGPLSELVYSLFSTENLPVVIDVRERYRFDATVPGGTGGGCQWSAELRRTGLHIVDGVSVMIEGQDPVPGAMVQLNVGNPLYTVAVPDVAPGGTVQKLISMRQMYPNPFSSSGTRLAFELHAPGTVAVDIFDVRGRRVRSLREQKLGIGAWEMGWNGRDRNGARIAAGIYTYRVRLNGQAVHTGRVVNIH